MSLNDFINKWNGKACDFDGWYGNQCVDLMNQYLVEVLGVQNPIQSFPGSTAYEIYQNANDPRFDKIDNTPTGVPQAGDIIFWNTSIGSAGHVAIFESGDTNNFKSFDQNFPTGSLCHTQAHDYNGVAGWLHFKSQTQAGLTGGLPSNYAEIIDKATKYDAIHAAGYTTIDDILKKVGDLTNENTGLKTQLQQVNQSNSNLADELKKKNEEDATAIDAGLTAESNLKLARAEEDKIGQEVGVSPFSLQGVLDAIQGLKKPIADQVKSLQDHALTLQNELPSLEKKSTSKKGKSLIQKIGDFFTAILK